VGWEGVGIGVGGARSGAWERSVQRDWPRRGVGDSLLLVLVLDGGRGFARGLVTREGQGLKDPSACAWEVA